MNNYIIAGNFSLLARLTDICEDDSFKVKSYSSAAFTIGKLAYHLPALTQEKIFAIKGTGQAIGKKILEQFETEKLSTLDEYILKTLYRLPFLNLKTKTLFK